MEGPPCLTGSNTLDDDEVISINAASELLGFSKAQLELWALAKSFGLRSVALRKKRQFMVCDLRAFLEARNRALYSPGGNHAKPHPAE